MIQAGTTLQGRYRVDRQIGQGGMGAVFIATDERFGATVAIKETFFNDEKFRKAFEREARLLNSLRHHALPRVSDHFIEGQGQFLVMEFIDGDDLSEQLESGGGAFAVGDVCAWADQLLDALEYLHTQEMPVIHRDIKPQNLKLNSRGQVILLDFGLAKGNPTSPDSATAAKSIVGYSRNYASIEQIQGSGTDPRSDLYSLGATLYHLMTGTPPADALTRAMNVLSGKPDPLIDAIAIRGEIPVGVSRLLTQAMALNADDRPATAREMRDLLTNHENVTSPIAVGTIAELAPATGVYARETEILPDQSINAQQSAIKTETFSNEDSRVTQIKIDQPTDSPEIASAARSFAATPPTTSRRGLLIGAAAAGLLIAATGTAALFTLRPDIFQSGNGPSNLQNPPTESRNLNQQNVPPTETATAANTANNINSNVTSALPGAATDSKPKDAAGRTEAPVSEIRETDPAKPDPRATPDATPVPKTPEPKAEIPQANDDRPPVATPGQRPIPPEIWQKMTPRQRRQLREAMDLKRSREQSNRPSQPRPMPPPDNRP